jgi:hypothetical protein
MKIIKLAMLAGMLPLVIQAQEQSDTVSVPVRANDLRIELPDSYKKMWPEQFDDYKRGYTLSNGQTLYIRSLGSNMYAFVDNDQWHKIVAVAPNTFVALDRQLKMEINLHEDDGASGWLTMIVPSRQLSGGGFVPEKIVSFAMR